MRIIGVSTLCLLAAIVWPAATAAGADSGQSGSTKLAYEISNEAFNLQTPHKALVGGVAVKLTSDKGEIDINGNKVALAGAFLGADQAIGVDVNGNGTVEQSEVRRVVLGTVAFKVKVGADKKEVGIGFQKIAMAAKPAVKPGGPNVVSAMSCCVFPAGCLKGSVNGAQVRILDDNLDGKITQDGKDSIVIGSSMFAQPLMKQHLIGNALYELKVSEDGTSLDYAKVSDVKLDKVDVPLMKSPAVGCLVLVDDSTGRVVDVAANKTGIPAGSYKLCYGTIGAGIYMLTIRPTTKMAAMDVKDEGANNLKIGPAFKLDFKATYNAAKNVVTVMPFFTVEGAGNERYDVALTSSMLAPMVTFMEGNRTISRESMSYG